MKKFIYTLALAISLTLTGCSQWVEGDPLRWENGDVVTTPELTIKIPEQITTETLSFTTKVKNASSMAFVVVEGSKKVDYQDLMYGYVSGVVKTSITTENFEHTFKVDGIVAGRTYTLYAAVADKHRLMTTLKKNINAIDGVSPYIIGDYKLTATNCGTLATVTFNEPIVHNSNMGAITYDIYNENLEVILSGTAHATAVSNQLTVSLPAPASFDATAVVLLSFEQGAVKDAHGNEMTAIKNVVDEEGYPTGPWWLYEGYISDGHNYVFTGKIDVGSGTRQQFRSPAQTLTYVANNVTIDGVTAKAWTMPSILNALSSGVVTANEAVPAYTYTKTIDGKETGIISFYDTNNGTPLLGTVVLDDADNVYEVYAADYDMSAGKIYPGWDFALSQDLYRSDYSCNYIGACPVIITIDNDTKEIMIVADIDPETFQFTDGETFTGSYKVNMRSTPTVIKNIKIHTFREKILRYSK